jgi:tetratricopeptide (TPR) repeat protein
VRWRALVLILACAAAYANALHAPFILDDTTAIEDNLTIRSLPGSLVPPRETATDRRPVVNLSLALNYAYGGLDVTSYRVVNLALHLACALLLFGIVRRTLALPAIAPAIGGAAVDVAWMVALVWGLHPLNSEVVNYITQRTESLMALAYFASVYCAIRAVTDKASSRWVAGAIAACAAGALCKESIATAPLVVVLYDRTFLFDSFRAAIRRRVWLYAGLAGSWMVLALVIWLVPRGSTGFGTAVSPWLYLLNQSRLIVHYVALSVWPRPLVIDYGLPIALTAGDVWLSLSVLGAAAAAAAMLFWRRPAAGFCLAGFFITLAPTSSVVPIATEVGAERRMYLPLAFLTALAVIGVYFALRRAAPRAFRVRRAVAAVVCALLAIGIVMRNHDYNDPLTLARVTVERWPNGRAHVELGTALVAAGMPDEALTEFERGARDYAPGHYPLGAELVGRGRVDEGIDHLREFIRQYPGNRAALPAHRLIATALVGRGQFEEAATECGAILARYPTDATTLVLMGDIRLNQRRFTESVQAYEAARRADPSVGADGLALTRLASALAYENRMTDAATVAREAMRVSPADPRVQKFAGNLLAASGDLAAAADAFRRAVDLDPRDQEAKALLARAEAEETRR